MKSNDFNVNEAINWFGRGPAFTSATSNPQKVFVNDFIEQYNLQKRTHPNLTTDDFLGMYFKKNNWDTSKLPPAYQQSLTNAAQAVSTSETRQNVQQLANVVYSLATIMPSGRANAAAAAASAMKKDMSMGDGQLDPNTNQIISKIRSIKNTPEEIDDLVDIIAISLFKLYKIAPKNYKRIVTSLFNNGGKPSMPSPQTVNAPAASQAPAQTAPTTQTATAPAAPSTPDYSGGVRKVAPSSVTYNNNIKPTAANPDLPTITPQPRGTVSPGNRDVEFTGQGLGRIEPTMDKPKISTLDKRINARKAARNTMTTASGLPK